MAYKRGKKVVKRLYILKYLHLNFSVKFAKMFKSDARQLLVYEINITIQ